MQSLIHHLLQAGASRSGDKEALVCRSERLTYSQMLERCVDLADGLAAAGASRLDRIGILLDPSISLAVAIFGTSRAGGVFVPIHHSLLPDQVEHIVRDCRMTALITDAAKYRQLQPMLRQCPSIKFVVIDGDMDEEEPAGSVERWGFQEMTSRRPAKPRDEAGIGKDLAAILYTSGSTGKPKGVMLSHANVIAGASIVSKYLEITDEERILAALPFSFDAGLNQLMTAIRQGATCVMVRFLFAKEIVDLLVREKITGLAGVPPLWNLIAQESSGLSRMPLPHLRYITNTGGALPLTTLGRLRSSLTSTKIFLMYGLTEAFRSTYLPPEELDRRPTSMGKAIPDTEILVLNDDGKPCAAGEIGELVHRGPTVSLGYWGRPDLTNQVLRPNPLLPSEMGDCEKVCYSGDLVKTDEEGFLYFVGRRDNQIKSSGFRISPTEVEAAFSKTGQVRDVAVIGLPDEILGQRIKAFVVPMEGITVDPGKLLATVAQSLPRYMLPKAVEALAELPKTSSGKIDYSSLRRREAQTPAAN